MVKLTGSVVDVLLYEYDADEFLRRISNPYWFQAFSCVLGFDWHSSGTTTTTWCNIWRLLKLEKEMITILIYDIYTIVW